MEDEDDQDCGGDGSRVEGDMSEDLGSGIPMSGDVLVSYAALLSVPARVVAACADQGGCDGHGGGEVSHPLMVRTVATRGRACTSLRHTPPHQAYLPLLTIPDSGQTRPTSMKESRRRTV